VSRGIVELRRSRLPLGKALDDAIETSRPLIEQAGHELVVSRGSEELVVEADPTRIVQVLANLLNNAAKFTPRGGRIELRLSRSNSAAVISVRDNGVGIAPTMLDSVFDMFTQVDQSHAQAGGGLGIGLTLVKRLVEMHGGSVEAKSGGLDAGSEFVVRLPLAAASVAANGASAGATGSQAASAGTGDALTPEPPPAPRPPMRRIVVADDNVDAAESLSLMLEISGHETRTAHDGEHAFLIASEFRPDVMVLDIAMPGLDGHDLARRIRSEVWGKSMLLIAASGWGQKESKQQSRDAGFDHHLVKPVEFDALELLLRNGAG
ncbi:MAG: ATP-binding protein, partial [Betaproteobacteria bacterium]